jgi:hypothetical protein
VSECKAWAEELKTRPDRKEAYQEAAGGEKPDGQGEFLEQKQTTETKTGRVKSEREGEFLDEPRKAVAAAKKMPEMVELVRQALKELLAADFPTFIRAKARQGVARGRRSKSVVTRSKSTKRIS